MEERTLEMLDHLDKTSIYNKSQLINVALQEYFFNWKKAEEKQLKILEGAKK